MNGLVVIPCGAAELTRPAPARDLYTGAYFRSCRRAAEALRPALGWLILSAKHGLIRPDTVLAPYELTLRQPGAVTTARLIEQARALGVTDARPVVVLAGRLYASAALTVWPHARSPLQQVAGGMGHQMAYLAGVARSGAL